MSIMSYLNSRLFFVHHCFGDGLFWEDYPLYYKQRLCLPKSFIKKLQYKKLQVQQFGGKLKLL